MKEAFTMWRHTRMIALTAICAAVYVAVLLPFKIVAIVPGLTEFRPGAAMPVLLSFMFGPAGAWGAAFGNLISDLLGGMFGPGSLFGFVGNFFYGFLPYKLWRALRSDRSPVPKTFLDWVSFQTILVVSSMACGLWVGWGVDLLKLFPFIALANIISLNNILSTVILVNILIFLVYPRIEKWHLLYTDILDEGDISRGRFRKLGATLVIISIVGAMVLGSVLSYAQVAGDAGPEILEDFSPGKLMGLGFEGKAVGSTEVGAGLSPLLSLFLVGCLLL